MAAPTTIAEAVTQAVLQPASVTDKGQSITERPLRDLLDAAERLKGTTAGAKPARGLRFTKLVPPGCQ